MPHASQPSRPGATLVGLHARRLSSMAALWVLAATCACGGTISYSTQPLIARTGPSKSTGHRTPRPPPPVEPSMQNPEAAAMLRQGLATPAVAFSSNDPPKLTALAVEGTGRSEARGLAPEGGMRFVTLAEGQRASEPLDLAPGDCVTVVAHGGLGIMEVDAFVLGPGADDDLPNILATDTKDGPMAVVGGQSGCFVYLGSAPMKASLVVQARRGAGPVVMQLFRARTR